MWLYLPSRIKIPNTKQVQSYTLYQQYGTVERFIVFIKAFQYKFLHSIAVGEWQSASYYFSYMQNWFFFFLWKIIDSLRFENQIKNTFINKKMITKSTSSQLITRKNLEASAYITKFHSWITYLFMQWSISTPVSTQCCFDVHCVEKTLNRRSYNVLY